MSKPTIIQSILHKPSQTYYFPSAKEYYSTKHDILRTVSVSPSASNLEPPRQSIHAPSPPSSNTSTHHGHSSSSSSSGHPTPSSQSPRSRRSLSPAGSDNPDAMAHSNNTLIRTIASSQPSASSTSSSNILVAQPPPVHRHAKFTPQNNHLTDHRGPGGQYSDIDTTDDDAEEDVFYTPRSSFYSSPRTSRTSSAMLVDPKALVSALLPSSSKIPQSATYRTSSESLLSSTSSSAASSDADQASLASTSRATTSTRITTPIQSDSGTRKWTMPTREFEAITISASKPNNSQETHRLDGTRPRPRPLSTTVSDRRRRSQAEIRRLTYTDEDWAKDVRWLTPAPTSTSSHRHRRAHSADSSSSQPRAHQRSSRPPPSYPPQAKSAERRQRSSARRSRGSRSSRGRMSALMEEDESDSTDVTPAESSTEPSRPPSPIQESPPQSVSGNIGDATPKSGSPLRTSTVRSKSQRSSRSTSSANAGTPAKCTAPSVRESLHDSPDDAEELEALESPDARVQAYARSHRRSYSHTRPLSRSTTPTRPDPSAYAKTLPTHTLPTPHISSGSVPNGYTSLTMAHAGYDSKSKILGDGNVDLVKAGIAQSTMATVEVVQGVAQVYTGTFSTSKRKRRTLSISLKFLSIGRGRRKEGLTPSHLLEQLPLPVAFTAHLPPPSFVPPSHVLIQVFAVGLDSLDSTLVQDKVGLDRTKANGFIPGRSVVGRVVECGWEVKGDVCKRGDWIIGLLEPRKSGALAEFLVLERHRLHRAPQPRSRPTTLFPSASNRRSHARSLSLPSHLHMLPEISNIPMGTYNHLSIEELALLPLNALSAHRAIRTLADVIVSNNPTPQEGEACARALVLHGHDGPGSMVVQMLSRRGVKVWAQVPESALRSPGPTTEGRREPVVDDPHANGGPDISVQRREGSLPIRSPRTQIVEARLRAWGARDICIGEPLEVIERLAEDGQPFDAVIDTVGGAEIWAASQKILLTVSASNLKTKSLTTHAQFTTLVGDNPDRPIPTAQDNLRSGFRSFRRAVTVTLPAIENSISSVRGSPSKRSTTSLPLPRKGPKFDSASRVKTLSVKRTVGYSWVNVAADVDYEGEDVRDALGAVVGMVEEGWIRPWIGDDEETDERRVVPFDRAPEVFRKDVKGAIGLLQDGGTCVIKVAG